MHMGFVPVSAEEHTVNVMYTHLVWLFISAFIIVALQQIWILLALLNHYLPV